MKIFVINICDERWSRYSDDSRFTRWVGCNGRKLSPSFIKDNYIIMWNAKESHKQCVAGCSESHLSLLKHIYENEINDVLIVEDDVNIDFDRLSELEDINHFCYLGGHFQSPVLKNKLNRENISLKEGINKIDIDNFTIAGAYGYYIPHHQISCDIYHDIMFRNKRRGFDCELRRLQKNYKLIKKFIYPAIVELYLPVAQTGFSCQSSNFKLTDSKKYY